MNNKDYKKLKNIANNLGYNVALVDSRFACSCAHFAKQIYIAKSDEEGESIFGFAHELGHCKQFKRRWHKFNENKYITRQFYRNRNKKKYRIIMDEIEAWILGYFILLRNKINIHGYWMYAFYCLETHLKRKPNIV